jgi:Tol biopolymer transport system component
MSPEQARGRAVDRRADIWAFGCVLFEMLTGRRAFPGDDVSDLLVAIIRDEPDWSALPPQTPERVRTLLGRCLQKDPRKRLPHSGLVRFELAEIDHAPEATSPAAPPRMRHLDRVAWALLGAAVVGLAGLAFSSSSVPNPQRGVIRFQIAPPVGGTMPGANGAPRFAVSRDGRAVVYQVAMADGQNALWIRRTDEAVGRPIRGTETGMSNGLVQPFMSPDGRSVAFFDEPDRILKRVDIETGAATALATVAGNQTGGSWSPTGTIVFSTTMTGGVQRVTASGGTATTVTTVDRSKREASHLFPEFLPDGRRFLYLARYDDSIPSAVFVGSLDGSPPVRVLESPYAARFSPPDRLLYVLGGALVSHQLDLPTLALVGQPATIAPNILRTTAGRVAFAAADDGTLVYATGLPGSIAEGVWVDRSGRPLDAAPLSMREVGVRLSPDGRTLAFFAGTVSASTPGDELWVYDVGRAVPTQLTKSAGIGPISFSPDGTRVVFRGADGALQIQSVSGATPPTPIVPGSPSELLSAQDWSSDGRHVVFAKTVGGGRVLFLMQVGSGEAPRVYLDGLQSPLHAQLSPDGRWLAYSSGNASSRQVYVQSFPDPSLGRWPVSRPGGAIPRWRRDGRELYFIDDAGWVSSVSVVPRGTGLEFGSPSPLFQAPPVTTMGYPYDVSVDGQRFIVMRPPSSGPSAILTVEIPP